MKLTISYHRFETIVAVTAAVNNWKEFSLFGYLHWKQWEYYRNRSTHYFDIVSITTLTLSRCCDCCCCCCCQQPKISHFCRSHLCFSQVCPSLCWIDDAYDGGATCTDAQTDWVGGAGGAIAVCSTGFCTCVDLTDCIMTGVWLLVFCHVCRCGTGMGMGRGICW